jgi:hypothetical protein
MLVQIRAASRASTYSTLNQPKSLLASARFMIPMLKCLIPAKLYARREARKFRTDVEASHKSMPTMCAGTWPFRAESVNASTENLDSDKIQP